MPSPSTVSHFEESLPRVVSMGRSIFDPVWAQKEHSSPRTELMHVLLGSVRVETPEYSISGREGDTIYTPTGTPHRDVFPTGTVFEVYLVMFDWPGEQEILRTFDPPQLARGGQAARRQIAADFQHLHQEFLAHRPFADRLIGLRLLQIIYSLCREASAGRSTDEKTSAATSHARRRQIMGEAKAYILANFSREVSLDQIAESIDISPYYLSRVFSEESGFTLSEYLTTLRMEKAVELLKDARRNISQVAHAVGYRDSHYFAKVFKAHFGQPPRVYRIRNSLAK